MIIGGIARVMLSLAVSKLSAAVAAWLIRSQETNQA